VGQPFQLCKQLHAGRWTVLLQCTHFAEPTRHSIPRTDLEGRVALDFGGLSQLETLDLSHNKLVSSTRGHSHMLCPRMDCCPAACRLGSRRARRPQCGKLKAPER